MLTDAIGNELYVAHESDCGIKAMDKVYGPKARLLHYALCWQW